MIEKILSQLMDEKNRAYVLAGFAVLFVGVVSMMIGDSEEEIGSGQRRSRRSVTKASTLSADKYIYYDSEIRLPKAHFRPQPEAEEVPTPKEQVTKTEKKMNPTPRDADPYKKKGGKNGNDDGMIDEQWNDWGNSGGFDDY